MKVVHDSSCSTTRAAHESCCKRTSLCAEPKESRIDLHGTFEAVSVDCIMSRYVSMSHVLLN